MNNFYPENTREIRGNSTGFKIVEIPNRRTADRPFFDDLEALVYKQRPQRLQEYKAQEMLKDKDF